MKITFDMEDRNLRTSSNMSRAAVKHEPTMQSGVLVYRSVLAQFAPVVELHDFIEIEVDEDGESLASGRCETIEEPNSTGENVERTTDEFTPVPVGDSYAQFLTTLEKNEDPIESIFTKVQNRFRNRFRFGIYQFGAFMLGGLILVGIATFPLYVS